MNKEELVSALGILLDESPESVAEREQTTHDKLSAPFNNQIILFGTGKLGRRTLRGLREVGIEPLAFCDNNPKIWGEDIEGLKVLSPEQAVRDFGNKAAIVVTIWNDRLGHPLEEVREQLQSYGECIVVSFLPLYWRHSSTFLPYFSLDLPSKILANKQQLLTVSELISDEESRLGFLKNIQSRFKSELEILPKAVDKKYQFNGDFLKSNSDEVFIDAGAYNGDTLKLILESSQFEFKEYIALEPDPKNFVDLNRFVGALDKSINSKIATYPVAVSNFNGQISFDGSGTEQAQISSCGGLKVDCRRIDDLLINKDVTFIKMDIEGAELDAIQGASAVLKAKSPVLAISVYHQLDHLWKLACLINNINIDYSFLFRPHAAGGWDYILYAVPQSRLKTPISE